jgi:hypothetical protein
MISHFFPFHRSFSDHFLGDEGLFERISGEFRAFLGTKRLHPGMRDRHAIKWHFFYYLVPLPFLNINPHSAEDQYIHHNEGDRSSLVETVGYNSFLVRGGWSHPVMMKLHF